ncbi:MAG: hypothetical protein M3R63_09220 [Actinomycetota bacterium]|nr:hypothetical protein [Actinomycetota bacterium]
MTPNELRVDPDVVARIASRLEAASAELATVGDAAPGMPDAGELSGAMAEVISNFIGAAAELVVGVAGAGELVARGSAEYLEAEQSNTSPFQSDHGLR